MLANLPHRGPIILGCLLGALLSAPTMLRAADADPDLTAIKRKLHAWRKSFATIRVVWHSSNRQDFIEANPKLDPDRFRTHYSRYEFAWADWGAFRKELVHFKGTKRVYRDMSGAEGSRPWYATTRYGGNTDQWATIQHLRSDPSKPLQWNIVSDGIYGLWNSSGFWLDELLERRENVTLKGYENLDGHRCAVVQMSLDANTKQPREDTFWLDPAHGFLPRKVVVRRYLTRDSLWHDTWIWTVETFQRVNGRVWFPATGTFRGGTEKPPGFVWTVKKVTLNESLPRSFFQAPRPQKGTQVIDYRRMKVPGGGGRGPGQGSTSDSSAANPIQAVIPSSLWRWIVLTVLVLATAGLLWYWRVRTCHPRGFGDGSR